MAAESDRSTAQPASWRLRKLTKDDSACIAGLAGQLGYPSTTEQVERRLQEVLSRPDNIAIGAEITAAPHECMLVGWIHGFLFRALESDTRVEVAGLVVDQKWRGCGIGQSLIAALEEWSREQGCSVVALRSNVIRTAAHAFYDRLGFQRIKTQISFQKTLGPGSR